MSICDVGTTLASMTDISISLPLFVLGTLTVILLRDTDDHGILIVISHKILDTLTPGHTKLRVDIHPRFTHSSFTAMYV